MKNDEAGVELYVRLNISMRTVKPMIGKSEINISKK